ncbi:MAG: KamA family radical SAM protein [Vampirovibrionales bacterium]|nr:KamA family radical SAM protein [Vampirovibrionales bacterium]
MTSACCPAANVSPSPSRAELLSLCQGAAYASPLPLGCLASLPSIAEPLKTFGIDKTQPHWRDWKWQFKNRLTSAEQIGQYLHLTADEKRAFQQAGTNLPFAITPYYLDAIDATNPQDPIRKTVVPRIAELLKMPGEYADPCGEDSDMVVPGLVHRYPDRVLLLVNETCSVYCRYCTRSRLVGSGEHEVDLEAAYTYLENHPEVRDVLISGGDPLVMADHKLETIISRLRSIPHIELVRLGTKIPVVLPQRITPELVAMLKRYAPFYMSIHFLHPAELTPEVVEACNRLADAGIMTFSQTVLLQGVNDDPETMKTLMHGLLKLRVRPYYIYQCDPVEGTSHFRTSIETGMTIMEHLRGHTTGYAVPTYVVDAPGGGGKVPVSPHTATKNPDGSWSFTNYAGNTYTY